jgi:predicted NBD/HSP70 family sugar kinase
MIATAAIDRAHIVGIGIGVAGVVDPARGLIRSHPELGWQAVAVGEALATAPGAPVRVMNIVHALAVR